MEKVKSIISPFINTPPGEIVGATVIDKSVIKGSILIHRMYAALAAEGVSVKNYSNIKTFDDLVEAINGVRPSDNGNVIKAETAGTPTDIDGNIGIDIETIANMPVAEDYREHSFYQQNFTPKEISHCSLKSTPLQSFLGLFCAKEALCKVNPLLAKKMFNEIEIAHDTAGRPLYEGYSLSISHTNDLAVAVAVRAIVQNQQPAFDNSVAVEVRQQTDDNGERKNRRSASTLPIIAIVISVCSLILCFLMMRKIL